MTAIALAGISFTMLAAGDRLDMNAADDTQNAPSLVDSRFVVRAEGRCAAAAEDAREILRTSDRAQIRGLAATAAATCERLGAELASVERQKAWTLPPPGMSSYGPFSTLSESRYVAVQCGHARALVALFDEEAGVGRDSTLRALVQRHLPALQDLRQALLCSGMDTASRDLPALPRRPTHRRDRPAPARPVTSAIDGSH